MVSLVRRAAAVQLQLGISSAFVGGGVGAGDVVGSGDAAAAAALAVAGVVVAAAAAAAAAALPSRLHSPRTTPVPR